MQKLLVPVLVLAAVALSSSNVLPILATDELNAEPLGFDYHDSDNIFSNKHQTRNKLNSIFFNVDVEPELDEIQQPKYQDIDEDFESIDKDDNYNDKGFRKEQWHNYPRQLDRLNRYFYQHQSTDKRNLDPDESSNVYTDEPVYTDSRYRLERSLDEIPNDLLQGNYPDAPKINNEAEIAAAVFNPLLIFRIHLACFNKDTSVNQSPQLNAIDLDNGKVQEMNKEENSFSSEMNPETNVIKVKREGKTNLEGAETEHEPPKSRTVNKRIFALFSRLQSLNPKGHQLHHRRHMYALYGPPDTEGGGGGVLTAETRATFMRPPGSPLRWG